MCTKRLPSSPLWIRSNPSAIRPITRLPIKRVLCMAYSVRHRPLVCQGKERRSEPGVLAHAQLRKRYIHPDRPAAPYHHDTVTHASEHRDRVINSRADSGSCKQCLRQGPGKRMVLPYTSARSVFVLKRKGLLHILYAFLLKNVYHISDIFQ